MEKIVEKLKDFYQKYKYAFCSSVIFTFITHLYFFSSRFANEDDLNYLSNNVRMLSSGRFTTGTLFTGELQIPIVKFLCVIIVLAIVSVLICDLFQVKKNRDMVLLSLVLSTFPVFSMAFGYLFMTEVYMMALLFSVLAVYLTVKFKYGIIVSSFLIAFSLGNYQSYIGVASGLSVLYLIKMILDSADLKDIGKTFVKLLIMGVLGIFLYFLILKIYLNIFDVSLSNYKGADSMGIPPVSEWIRLFIRTYKDFIGYFLGRTFYKSTIFYIVVRLILFFLCFIVLLKRMKVNHYKNWYLLLICIILLPLAINVVDFMVYKTTISVLNIYQFVLIYVACIIIISYKGNEKNKFNSWILVFSIVCLVTVGYENFVLINKYYLKIEEFYDYTVSITNRLLTRIEGVEGYNYDMPVMFVGEIGDNFYNLLMNKDPWEDIVITDQGLWGRYIGFEDIYYFESERKIIDFIKYSHGVFLKSVDYLKREEIKKMEELKNMDAWPSNNSIKIIDNVLVVKF